MSNHSPKLRTSFGLALLLLLAALAASWTATPARAEGAGIPTTLIPSALRPQHPRVFLTDALIAQARERIAASPNQAGTPQKYFRRLRGWGDDRMRRGPNRRDQGTEAAGLALLYLLTDKPAYLKAAREFLESSVRYYAARDQAGKPVSWNASARINALCAYDWLYNHLSPEERARLGRSLMDHVSTAQNGRGRNLQGHESGFYGTPSLLWYAGLVFDGAGVDDARARDFLEEGFDRYTKLLDHRRRLAGDDGGQASHALNYAFQAYPWAEFNFFHTFASAFGRDISADWPHVANQVNYLSWNLLPGFRWFGAGDAHHEDNRIKQSRALYTHLAQIRHFYGASHPRQAGLAAWLQAQFEEQKFDRHFPAVPLLLAGLDASPAPVEPDSLALPLARHFEGMGQVFMRSGSGDRATYALFNAGGLSDAHRHFDQNAFTIYHQGFLALDSGARPEPGSHLFNYFARTVAHNAITIRMPGEELPRYWGRRAPGEPDLPTPNDGGQNQRLCGDLVAFESQPEYAYAVGDASNCYDPAKASLVLRQFLFLPPEHFVILDRVVATDPDFPKRWLLHTAGKPRIEGAEFQAREGGGRLRVRTLLPENPAISRVGGRGRQFWNDGRNWPLPSGFSIPASNPLLGQWRIEVNPGTPRTDDLFLHILRASDRQNRDPIPEAQVSREGDQLTVAFREGELDLRLELSLQGNPPAGRIVLNRGGETVTRDLARTVQPQSGMGGE